jgi:thiol-disulfide isomerase/thioredoxin
MRYWVCALLWVCLSFAVAARESKKEAEKKAEPPPKAAPATSPAITLKVGDAPPPLTATKWLQGAEVKSFESGKVYVVEFWATWCGPCIAMMPHLSDLQREYRDKGVTVIGYTAKDEVNTAEKVAAFVEKRGPKLDYTIAYSEKQDSFNAWMDAAGRNGIPCSFVVGKDTRIAYIGHPMFLGVILPKVVAGTWKVEQDNEKLQVVEADVRSVYAAISAKPPEEGLKALAEFEKKYPELEKLPNFVAPKLGLLLRQDQVEEAMKFAAKAIAEATERDDSSMLGLIASTLTGPEVKKSKELSVLALDTAAKMVQVVGDKDVSGQMTLARVRFATGDKAKAKEAAERVVELAPESLKAGYKRMLKEILGDPGPAKKDGEKP